MSCQSTARLGYEYNTTKFLSRQRIDFGGRGGKVFEKFGHKNAIKHKRELPRFSDSPKYPLKRIWAPQPLPMFRTRFTFVDLKYDSFFSILFIFFVSFVFLKGISMFYFIRLVLVFCKAGI